jgi:hypothetical protein
LEEERNARDCEDDPRAELRPVIAGIDDFLVRRSADAVLKHFILPFDKVRDEAGDDGGDMDEQRNAQKPGEERNVGLLLADGADESAADC